MKKKVFIILFILILSLPSVAALFNSGFFQSDDGEWMIIRYSAFHQAFRDGQFPVRFLGRLNNGYGYPVANFLYPGFMYLAEPVKIMGWGFVDTIKIIFGLAMLGSAIFAYLWLNRIFDRISSGVGALFYLYTPYHLYDLYKRGSIGEVLALAVIPFILWQIERKSFFWIGSGLAFLILTHNTLSLLFLPIIFLYMVLRRDRILSLKKQAVIILIALGLSGFFWIPAVFELTYTHFSNTVVSNFRNYFAGVDLIGYASILVIYLSALLFIYRLKIPKKLNTSRLLFLFFLILGFGGILLSSKASLILWNFLPSSFIQFPFRFLSYLILSISFLSSYLIYSLKGYIRFFILVFLIGILIYSSFSYLLPKEFFNKGDNFYSTNEGTTTVHDEYMPIWVKSIPNEHFKNKVEIKSGDGEIKNLVFNNKRISFDYNAIESSIIRVNTIYYPGWHAYIDDKEMVIDYSNEKGVMDIHLTPGENKVVIVFSETPLRKYCDLVTILSFAGLLILTKFHKTKSTT